MGIRPEPSALWILFPCQGFLLLRRGMTLSLVTPSPVMAGLVPTIPMR
jgi:hypothetical protein